MKLVLAERLNSQKGDDHTVWFGHDLVCPQRDCVLKVWSPVSGCGEVVGPLRGGA